MITYLEFRVLSSLATRSAATQRELAAHAGVSLGSANKALRSLGSAGLVTEGLDVTDAGREALEPFRVRGAVILAAGLGRRFAPLSFERPKALFRVRGEVLIERLIRQLRQSGVSDIYVVVGPMKESFYYLEDKLGVHLVQTTEYATRNNHASLWSARDHLANAYVCPADQYYEENFFHPFEYRSNCVAIRAQGKGAKQAFDLGANDLIVAARKDTSEAWRMAGPAYLDREFSEDSLDILEQEYNLPETEGKLWETIFIEHVDELHMFAHKLVRDTIHEFDYLGDLCAFDTAFMENVDSDILDNICRTLSCTRDDISDVRPLDSGLTNLSVLFSCKGVRYVYRHPGAGTDEIINREAETYALKVASKLGLDTSFIYEDPKTGWKISRFIEGCEEFDYGNEAEVKHALEIARTLHASDASSPWKFDFYDEGKKIWHLLEEEGWPLPADFSELAAQIGKLVGPMRAGAGAPVLCHNDFYGPNLLVTGDDICLIDWEYAAMGDYGCDFGNFIAQGSGYGVERALEVLPYYFGRTPTDEERLHCMACVAVVGWYWYAHLVRRSQAVWRRCPGDARQELREPARPHAPEVRRARRHRGGRGARGRRRGPRLARARRPHRDERRGPLAHHGRLHVTRAAPRAPCRVLRRGLWQPHAAHHGQHAQAARARARQALHRAPARRGGRCGYRGDLCGSWLSGRRVRRPAQELPADPLHRQPDL